MESAQPLIEVIGPKTDQPLHTRCLSLVSRMVRSSPAAEVNHPHSKKTAYALPRTIVQMVVDGESR